MSKPDLEKLIDDRILPIWNEVNKHYDTSVQYHNEPYYLCYSKENKVVIYIAFNNSSKDSFAHEVLHAYLNLKKINIGSDLSILIRDDVIMSSVFSNELLEHISNTIDHIKMLPIYLDLGFNRENFIQDYNTQKCTDQEIILIKAFIDLYDPIWHFGADLYLGKYFAMHSCPNNRIDYSAFISELKNIDNSLFNILDTFWTAWISYDIEKHNIDNYNYRNIANNFYDSLKEWVNLKKQ